MMLRCLLSVSMPPTGTPLEATSSSSLRITSTLVPPPSSAGTSILSLKELGIGVVSPDVTPQDSSGALTSLFRDSCVVDVWCHLHPYTSAFTWLSPDGNFSAPINLVGCPIPWLHHVGACDVILCPYSDIVAVFFVSYPCAPAPVDRTGALDFQYILA